MFPLVKCCQRRNCEAAAEVFVGRICFPGILSTTATSAIIKAQLEIGCLIWPGSKGEGQSCPAEIQKSRVSIQREGGEIGICEIPSRCRDN